MRFFVAAHPEKPQAATLKENIAHWLIGKGHVVATDAMSAELVIALGGDGYVMHCINLFSPKGIPTIGINVGDVGFITQGNADNWPSILEYILDGIFHVEKRIGLELVYRGKSYGPFTNDAYFKHSSSVAAFGVKLDDYCLYNEFFADGLIISTPTGSTGYNVSANGPIVQPGVSCLLLTPICPGHLNIRPLVYSPKAKVEIVVTKIKRPGKLSLMADGATIADDFPVGDSIIAKQHDTRMLVAVLSHNDFYQALQTKKGLMS